MIFSRYSADITVNSMEDITAGTMTTTIVTTRAIADITTDTAINAAAMHLGRVRLLRRRDSVRVRNALGRCRLATSFVPPVGQIWNRQHAKAAA